MRRPASLRVRLLALTLVPLVLVAVALGVWRYSVAQSTAEEIFDRSLLATALAISRDVTISGGDALTPATRDLLNDVSGGEVFYHVTGPDGVYITGYAYPPRAEDATEGPIVFGKGSYRGEEVRILQLVERSTLGNLTGESRMTVWQRTAERHAFARAQALRSLRTMGALLVVLAGLMWFGVARGLRPLTDLEAAIALRSPDDLTPIRRAVPPEVAGIVATLNRLISQMRDSIAAHQAFVSDAAHQLRNPATATLSLAQTARDAGEPAERDQRLDAVVEAARRSVRLTEQLLSLERLRYATPENEVPEIDLIVEIEEICAFEGAAALEAGLDFELAASAPALPVRMDPVHAGEAVKNLIDNARRHGGPGLHSVRVALLRESNMAVVRVIDDGIGLSPDDTDTALKRFGQIGPSSGSGLGLSITEAIAKRYGGRLVIEPRAEGASISIQLPISRAESAAR
ncbi:sensor histidine kinase [Profundibacterium mesophilum]|uniref:histidine kinase n=1 Tax=Profundibacterium mesophilum KAUST100406-0324 TaxID=1037889 RepID=A0A921TFW4_9RHOB|nr:sensor histidine kinase [Profundibacterium mesophilum]KAF0676844.1 two-component system OmpR family sensor histidine kinase TctE [Profundibacterium mesophilum KAUST100406-0324]